MDEALHRAGGLSGMLVDDSAAQHHGWPMKNILPGAPVVACAARLPFDEALAIADSALRSGYVTSRELVGRASSMPGRYRALPSGRTVRAVLGECAGGPMGLAVGPGAARRPA